MPSILHLQNKLEELNKDYADQSDIIKALRKALAIETQPRQEFQFKHQLQQAEDKRDELDEEITKLKKQIEIANILQISPDPDLCQRVYLKCDRDDQDEEFSKYLLLSARQKNESPQVYFIQGDERERHGSLVQRFQLTCIKSYAEGKSGEKRPYPRIWEIRWSYEEDLIESEKLLRNTLFHTLSQEFGNNYDFNRRDCTPSDFRRLLNQVAESHPLIILQHDIKIRNRDRSSIELIELYLKFWDEVKGVHSIPQVIIFLNIMYQAVDTTKRLNPLEYIKAARRKSFYRDCERQLSEVSRSYPARENAQTDGHVRCVLLPKLPCVRRADVMTWFNKNDIGGREVRWRNRCLDVVGESECKHMEDVESELISILNAIQRKEEKRLKNYGRR